MEEKKEKTTKKVVNEKNSEEKTSKKTLDKTKKVNDKKEPEVREVIIEKKVGFNYIEVILIMIITLVIGGFLGVFISGFIDKKPVTIIEKDKTNDKFKEFIDTYEDIKANYYEDVDDDLLIEHGIKGMLDFLGDKYSLYMDQEVSESFNESVEGKYDGIGVEIVKVNNEIIVNKVFSNSPAEKAGIKPNDKILKVFGEDCLTKDVSDIANIIRKGEKENIDITIVREDKELNFKVKRSNVEIDSVSSKIYENNGKKVGYIYISIFASNTYKQFLKELISLETDGIDSLIIDVRSNTGGYLNVVTDIASLFLNKGKPIYQLETKGLVDVIYDTSKDKRNYDIVVLTNEVSASASEILASAMQESYGAKVIGTNTYGKGTVQKAYQLESGATVKYTIQKWLTANGNWINEVGVTPDIKIELAEEYFTNPSDETDNQLQTAISELTK